MIKKEEEKSTSPNRFVYASSLPTVAPRPPVVLAAQPFCFVPGLSAGLSLRSGPGIQHKTRGTWGSPRLGSPHVTYNRNVMCNGH